ncbi:MAG: DUF559 domain-containing protein [Fibrobacterota bacterium]
MISSKYMSVLAARQLRRNHTKTETLVWECVRKKRFRGLKFLRQHPIVFEVEGKQRFFIVDFYCSKKKLLLEIDGSIHEQQMDYDCLRDDILVSPGYQIVHVNNNELSDKQQVLQKLSLVIT